MKRIALALTLALAVLAGSCSTFEGSGDSDVLVDPATTSGRTSSKPVVTEEAPVGDSPVAEDDTSSTDPGTDAAGQPATSGTGDGGAAPAVDPDLVWTVIAVEREDGLNVREDPDPQAPIVATLQPWSTGLDVTAAVETNASGTWRLVRPASGREGWVNGRFLVAQPAVLSDSDQDEILERAESLIGWATTGSDAENGDWMFADRALWVGGLGIYGDGAAGWNWFPATDVDRTADWDRVRTFELGPDFGDFEDCGSDCEKSLNDFMNFDRIDNSTNYLVDDIPEELSRGFLDGALWQAPETMHRVVVDTPTSDPDIALDWQRIHMIFDWSRGTPEVLLVHTHSWTP